MPLSWNLGTLTSWNPVGHSRLVTGLLYLYLLHYKCNISQHSFLAFLYTLAIIVQYFQRHQNQRFLCAKPVMHYFLLLIVISKLMEPFLGGSKADRNGKEPGLDNRLTDQDIHSSLFEGWLLYGQCPSVSFLDTILHNPCGTQGCHTLLNIQTPG